MAISPSMISAEEQSVRYYILRKPGNTMVPLIPVDQLPFQIHGVPRNLTHRQLSDERWEFLDETSEPATILPLSNPPNTHHFSQALSARKSKFRAPDHDVRSGTYEPHSGRPLSSPLPSSGALTTVTPPKAPQPCPKSLSDSFAELYPQDAQRFGYRPPRPAPSGIKPDPSKKVYCSHWIATGECKFNAQGCIYKHEMPSTQEELRKIGFTQVPKWYKEKQVFDRQGPTWMQRQQQKQKQEEDEERKKKEVEEENPASQVSVRASASPADLEEAKLKSIADTLRRARTTRSPTQEAQTPQKGPSKLNVLSTGDRSKVEKSLLIDLIDLQELDRTVSCTSSQSTASSITTVLDEAEEESVTNAKDYTDYTTKSLHPRQSQASIPSLASRTYDSDNFSDDDDEDDDGDDADDAEENEAPPSITAKAKQQLMARKVYPSKTSISTSTSTRTKPSPKPTTAGVRTPPPLPPPPPPTMCEAAPPARQPIMTTDPNLLSGKSTRFGESNLEKAKHASGGLMSSRWAPSCYERGSLGALGGQGGQDRGKIAWKGSNGKGRKKVLVE